MKEKTTSVGFLTAPEVARRFRVDLATVYWWQRTQRVAVEKIGEEFRFLSDDVQRYLDQGDGEPLLTAREVAAKLKISVETFHGMRARRAIPGIKLGRITWRFKWSEVESALAQNRLRAALPSKAFVVEPYNNAKRPNLRFCVYRLVDRKRTEQSYFESEQDAIAHASKRNRSIGTQPIAPIPDLWRGANPEAAAWRVRPYKNASQPNGARYMAFANFDKRPVKRFFQTEAEALDYANERNVEVAAERERLRRLTGRDDGTPERIGPTQEQITAGLNSRAAADQLSGGVLTSALTVAARALGDNDMESGFKVHPYNSKTCRALKWVVNGKMNGKRQRRFFKSEGEARTYAHLQNTELLNKGREALEFPTWLRSMAQRCQELLAPHHATIEDAAKFYLETKARRNASISLKRCIEEMIALRQQEGVSRAYVYELRNLLPRFAETIGPEVRVSEIGVREINGYLTTMKARRDPTQLVGSATRQQMRRLLATLFSFAKTHGYCAENPVIGAMTIRQVETEIGIFRPEEIAAMLRAVDRRFFAMLAIGAFAGLRVAELLRLDWRQVKLDRGYIEVTARNAKSARRRLVKIQPCLDAWIRPIAQLEGCVAPTKVFVPHKQIASAVQAAGLAAWVRNGLRHSFASYHLANWKDAAALALEMGHTTTNLIFAHYRQVVHETEAERYWNIFPPSEAESGKVVNFGA